MGFDGFYRTWLQDHRRYLQRLLSAPRDPPHHHLLQALVDGVVAHYHTYFLAKSRFAKQDVLAIFDATWSTTFERPFHWIAGWRPTVAFHLFYSESSLRFETQLPDILDGRGSRDLGDLDPAQLQRISDLHLETVREEKWITAQMADWQESFSDSLSELDKMMEELQKILEEADQLRLATIRRVVENLNPLQAVDFLTAAAELQIGIRQWGEERDGMTRGNRATDVDE
ncbi:protein DOG1-like 3 [Aristolochia californica]|uniref:protein DOG1-like 3 n=1 Tax=Aristolochia californica TaxID=171875 RepID=UPI0035E1D0E2